METRETKDAVDTIAMKSKRMSANIASVRNKMDELIAEQKKTNEFLEELVKIERQRNFRDMVR